MSNPPFLRAGLCLLRAACAPVLLIASLSTLHAQPGLDAPEAIGPYLGGKFPAVEPTAGGEWTVNETYQGININLPTHLTPYPGTNKLLCIAKEGRIFLFEDSPSANTTETFLDWRANTFTSSDSGMDWLVFHPEFGQAGSPNRGYVYITYKWAPATGGDGNNAYWRLSRFTVPDGSQAADPASEQILVQQYDRQQFHDSGCMMFGPDGYLYYAIGDEGGANDQYNVGQRINERLFSGVMRIDVDQKAGSHAIRRQPAQITMPAGWPNSFTAHYTIPNDNPFVDAGGANLEEFYAIGFRQPYRFSYDPVTQRTWVGESGQDTQEELSILAPGANYGWPFREGTGPGPQAQPAVIHGTLTEPVWSVAHAAGPDGCVVGGFVYRGAAHPSLVGKFITVDNVSGRIRAFDYANGSATGTILTDMPSGSVYSGTSTIGRDQAGEPVFIKINGTGTRGRFMKLAVEPPATANPVWYRFEDQAASNSSGYVSDNPGNKAGDSINNGLSLMVTDDESTSGANVTYSSTTNGLIPAGVAGNNASVRSVGAGDADGYPGNAVGGLTLADKFGKLDDFTVELSFRPASGSLTNGSYQCFFGLDGTSGTTSIDTENGPPIQPFRLMRWGRNGAGNSLVALAEGDLFLDIRTINPADGQWNSVPIKLLTKANFPVSQWYHLAIVGNVSAGTVTVYSYANGSYTQIGQQTGYHGNLPSSYWTVGRGMYGGGPADYALDARFDEVRIAPTALAPAQFLYANQAWQPTIVVSQPPALLSQTGAFSNLATLTPAQGVIPYGVNAPLWSDSALKKRWIALPNNGTHNTPEEKIGFNPEGSWSFPAGTVFIKHFELATDESNPNTHRRLETRFIVVPASGEPYGVTYRWRPDGSDAELLPDGLSEPITIHEAGGGTHNQTWDYPSRTDCRICHNGNAGHILGLKTWQLNGDLTYDRTGRTANQLETMGALGWFDSAYNPEQLPWFLKSHNISDTSASLEDRVRSYIDSNCSQCHRPGGVRAYFDARLTTPLTEQGLIRGALEVPYFDAGDRVIVPGDLARSILKVRHGTAGTLKMPPIAKSMVDEKAAQVIGDWILSLPSAPAVHLAAPSGAGGPFDVTVHFSEPVVGLSAADFSVLNGSVSGLTGSGADYTITLTPHRFGEVIVSLPANKTQAAGGLGNFASGETHTIVSDASLLAWLKLDEGTGSTAIDSSPAERHGTLLGMEPSDWITGKFGGALSFDGSGELVSMSNVATGDFTISFWMRTTQAFQVTNAPPSGRAIVTADAPGPSNDFMIAGTRGSNNQGGLVDRISFQTGFAGGAQPNAVIHGTSSVSTGNWVHIAATRVRATGVMKLYVNGVLEATGTGSTDLLNANSVLSFGGNPAGAATSYQGDLDQFRIHGRALSATEIQELVQETGKLPPYQQWLATWLPGLTHLHGLDLDPEHDGNSNFAEFAFGGSPTAYDRFSVPFTHAADGSVTLTYLVRKAPAGGVYHVTATSDLSAWTNIDAALTNIQHQDLPGTDYERITATYSPPPDSKQTFFRIEAQPE
ncbi:LamG-like jellyroll fold domain-containing protein [Haloferula sp. BvORR071]|uniref:LamG-like jellyroll fold domain-containing protein n=1 Tax=Haloferula sp. BvORR071 TaxID=1396141 RepID=UPI000552BA1E|nr:LamG-like jellyroll fold domain-containing protein [Haloferula sp. BvORR071]